MKTIRIDGKSAGVACYYVAGVVQPYLGVIGSAVAGAQMLRSNLIRKGSGHDKLLRPM
jgi:hypothetical protein